MPARRSRPAPPPRPRLTAFGRCASGLVAVLLAQPAAWLLLAVATGSASSPTQLGAAAVLVLGFVVPALLLGAAFGVQAITGRSVPVRPPRRQAREIALLALPLLLVGLAAEPPVAHLFGWTLDQLARHVLVFDDRTP